MLFPLVDLKVDDPELLISFLHAYEKHVLCILGFLKIKNYEMPTIPSNLKDVLGEDGKQELTNEFERVRQTVGSVDTKRLKEYGLLGRQLRFKLSYLSWVEERFYDESGNFNFDKDTAISVGGIGGTIFESVLDASGVGHGVKEISEIVGDAVGDAVDDALDD